MFFLFYKQRLLLASVDFSCKSQVCQLHSALESKTSLLVRMTILLKEAKGRQKGQMAKLTKKPYLNLTLLAYISRDTDCFDM